MSNPDSGKDRIFHLGVVRVEPSDVAHCYIDTEVDIRPQVTKKPRVSNESLLTCIRTSCPILTTPTSDLITARRRSKRGDMSTVGSRRKKKPDIKRRSPANSDGSIDERLPRLSRIPREKREVSPDYREERAERIKETRRLRAERYKRRSEIKDPPPIKRIIRTNIHSTIKPQPYYSSCQRSQQHLANTLRGEDTASNLPSTWDINIECHTRRSPFPDPSPGGNREVMASNNVVVTLTITSDHIVCEGMGGAYELDHSQQVCDRVACITIESGRGNDSGNNKLSALEINIRPDLLSSLNSCNPSSHT